MLRTDILLTEVDDEDQKDAKHDHKNIITEGLKIDQNTTPFTVDFVPITEPTFETMGNDTQELDNNANILLKIALAAPVSPKAVTALRRFTRVHTQVKSYLPSIKGKSYQYTATKLDVETSKQNPRVIELILTQLLLKAAIKMWGNDAKIAAKYDPSDQSNGMNDLMHKRNYP